MLAARRGKAAAVRELLEGGADPGLKNAQGGTALDVARVNKRADCVAALEAAGTAGGGSGGSSG